MVKTNLKVDGGMEFFSPDIFNAAANDDPSELAAAIEAGQNLDETQYGTGFTPLHVACINRSEAFLAEALKHKFDPWIRDVNLRLAIDHAAAHRLQCAHDGLLSKMYPSGPDGRPVMPF